MDFLVCRLLKVKNVKISIWAVMKYLQSHMYNPCEITQFSNVHARILYRVKYVIIQLHGQIKKKKKQLFFFSCL